MLAGASLLLAVHGFITARSGPLARRRPHPLRGLIAGRRGPAKSAKPRLQQENQTPRCGPTARLSRQPGGERFGEIAGFPPCRTTFAPPSIADGTPNGLAPVLEDLTIAGPDGHADKPNAAFTE